jgi:hypothetical protein
MKLVLESAVEKRNKEASPIPKKRRAGQRVEGHRRVGEEDEPLWRIFSKIQMTKTKGAKRSKSKNPFMR